MFYFTEAMSFDAENNNSQNQIQFKKQRKIQTYPVFTCSKSIMKTSVQCVKSADVSIVNFE